MSRTDELEKVSKKIMKLIGTAKELANKNDFGFTIDEHDGIEFTDWLSSSCYGEEENDNFGVRPSGEVWYSSSC